MNYDWDEFYDDRSSQELENERLRLEVCSVQGHLQPQKWERGLIEENGVGFSRCERCFCPLAEWLPKGKLVAWDFFDSAMLIILMSKANDFLSVTPFVEGNK